VAKLYFKPSNQTVGYYIPDSSPDRTVVPATPDLEATLKDYKSNVVISRAEVFDPTPANIEVRVARDKLANGMKLVMLHKKTAMDMVTAAIELRFGDATTLEGQTSAAQFAGALLMRGTKTKSRQQVAEEMRKLDAQITVSGGGGGGFGGRGGGGGRGGSGGGGGVSSASATVTAPAANFIPALRLAVDLLKDPAYPQNDFDRMLDQRLKALESAPTEPAQLAGEALNRHLSPWNKGDALYQETREEQIADLKKVTLDDVKKFHDRYYGANFGVFVVGPVDAAAVKKAAAELLGNWNTRMTYKPIVAPYKSAAAINQKIETPDKANAQFEAGVRFKMSEDDPDYPAMLLAGYMFGGPITSHISDRIRNREGLSYGANARVTIPSEGDDAMLSGTVSLNPMNGPKVEFSFTDELASTLRHGFTDAEVADARTAFLNARVVARSTDAALLAQLASHEQLGRTMMWDAGLEQKIQALTAAQVSAAFRKHIDPARLSIVKAGDWQAAKVYQ